MAIPSAVLEPFCWSASSVVKTCLLGPLFVSMSSPCFLLIFIEQSWTSYVHLWTFEQSADFVTG